MITYVVMNGNEKWMIPFPYAQGPNHAGVLGPIPEPTMTDLLRRNLIEFTPSGGVLRFATKDEGVQAVANMLPTDHCPRPFDPVEYEKVAIGVLCVLDNLVGRDNQLRDVALAIFNVAHRNGDYSEMVQAAMLLEDARRLDELRKLLPDEVHLVPHDYVIIERSADFLMNAILRTN